MNATPWKSRSLSCAETCISTLKNGGKNEKTLAGMV
jgi:hypothetical protein